MTEQCADCGHLYDPQQEGHACPAARSCGNTLAGLAGRHVCALEAGHVGWHVADSGSTWTADEADRRALELALDELVQADDAWEPTGDDVDAETRERELELAHELLRQRFPSVSTLDAERFPTVAELRRSLARSLVEARRERS